MITEVLIYGGLTFIGLVLSATFSGMETGLYTVNRVRLTVRAKRDDAAARRLQHEIDHPSRVLSTLLVANNIANYLASYGMAVLLTLAGLGPVESIVVNAAVLIPLVFVFGEVLPKDLFRTHTDHWSYGCAPLLRFVRIVLTATGLVPLVQAAGDTLVRMIGQPDAAQGAARERISRLMKEGIGAGVLSETQTTLVDRALTLRRLTVAAEMVPWSQVVRVDADETGRTVLTRLRGRHESSRLPVLDRAGTVIGIVPTLDLALQPDQTARDLMQPPLLLTPDLSVREAMRELRTSRQSMAIVVPARGRVPVGLVTYKDLVEPLTGEIADW